MICKSPNNQTIHKTEGEINLRYVKRRFYDEILNNSLILITFESLLDIKFCAPCDYVDFPRS